LLVTYIRGGSFLCQGIEFIETAASSPRVLGRFALSGSRSVGRRAALGGVGLNGSLTVVTVESGLKPKTPIIYSAIRWGNELPFEPTIDGPRTNVAVARAYPMQWMSFTLRVADNLRQEHACAA
jgi:hypothetical protein